MEFMKKEISVVMSSYRESESCLRQAIESVLAQTWSGFEFIIILDDPSNELHKKIIQGYQKRDPRICFYVNETNMGLVKSLNRAIGYAVGEYVIRMDADDICLPRRFEWQITEARKKKLDLLGSYLESVDERGKTIFVYDNLPLTPKEICKKIVYNNCIPHPSWLVRREVYEALDGYQEIPLCEDYDFILRAIRAGYRVGNLNKVALQYRMTAQSLSRSGLLKQYLISRYLIQCYKKKTVYDAKKAEQILRKNCTDKNSSRYNRSSGYFNKGLLEAEAGHRGRAAGYMIRAFVGSRFFAGKMLGFFRAAL